MKKIKVLTVLGMILAIVGASLFWGFGKVEAGMTIWAIGGALIISAIILDAKYKVLFWA